MPDLEIVKLCIKISILNIGEEISFYLFLKYFSSLRSHVSALFCWNWILDVNISIVFVFWRLAEVFSFEISFISCFMNYCVNIFSKLCYLLIFRGQLFIEMNSMNKLIIQAKRQKFYLIILFALKGFSV